MTHHGAPLEDPPDVSVWRTETIRENPVLDGVMIGLLLGLLLAVIVYLLTLLVTRG